MVRKYGVISMAVFAIVVSALVGGFLGRNATATASDVSDYRAFTAALGAVEANYIDTVDSKRLVYSAIGGMLQTLDPHSSFMDPDYYKRMRERQEGQYYGLGITIQVIEQRHQRRVAVRRHAGLQEGRPPRRHHRAHRRRGRANLDRRAGQAARRPAAVGAGRQAAARRRRARSCKVGLKRPGYDQPIDIEVPRDEINIPSITASFMVDAQTGYVKVQDFAEHTDRDLGLALGDLKAKGMKRLLLDLRGNPGGPLDQAIRVSNRFLPQGSLIVSTRGRVPNSDQDYRGDRAERLHRACRSSCS